MRLGRVGARGRPLGAAMNRGGAEAATRAREQVRPPRGLCRSCVEGSASERAPDCSHPQASLGPLLAARAFPHARAGGSERSRVATQAEEQGPRREATGDATRASRRSEADSAAVAMRGGAEAEAAGGRLVSATINSGGSEAAARAARRGPPGSEAAAIGTAGAEPLRSGCPATAASAPARLRRRRASGSRGRTSRGPSRSPVSRSPASAAARPARLH